MFTMGFDGVRLTPPMRQLIEEECLGGFFLQVLENFTFPEECAALVNEIQEAALQSRHGIPLFISMDQEGGVAAPLHYMMGATPTPGNMALGASGREEDAYAAYHAMGLEMRACGANVNYAPAIDVLKSPANPDYTVRSFSGSMALNAVMARGATRGLREAGVIACGKHFPGLAYFDEDTHTKAPHLLLEDEELWEGDLAHWRAAIEAGMDMIMTCHVYVPAWDIDYPVTLSRKILRGILREKLGYDGIILTDSMGMGSIGKKWKQEEAAVLAVKAGCDRILQVSRNVEELRARAKAIVESVNAGEIAPEQIDASVRRILRAKDKYGLLDHPQAVEPEKVLVKLRRPDLVQANRQAALNGIVVVRDEAKLLPLPKDGKRFAVICPPSSITRAGKGEEVMPVGYTLGHYVRGVVPEAAVAFVDTVPKPGQRRHALTTVSEADVILLGQLLAYQSPKQVEFIKEVLTLGKPTVIVGLGVPSDLALFPEAPVYVAANSPAPICVEAAVNVLFGEAQPGGKLPMPIGALYPIGHAVPPGA